MSCGALPRLRAVFVLGILAIVSGGSPASGGPVSTGPDGPDVALRVVWTLLGNDEDGFASELTLTNEGDADLPATGWAIYFNLQRPIPPEGVSPTVDITHVNGDLHRLRPAAGFDPLEPGASRGIAFRGGGDLFNRANAPTGFYIVFDDDPDAARRLREAEPVIPLQAIDRPAHRGAVLAPDRRYHADEAVRRLADAEVGRVLPMPLEVRPGSGRVMLTAASEIRHETGLEAEARYLAEALGEALGAVPALAEAGGMVPAGDPDALPSSPEAGAPGAGILLRTDGGEGDEGSGHASASEKGRAGAHTADGDRAVFGPGNKDDLQGSEAYRLEIGTDRGVVIIGGGPAGVFYGIQTLRSLIPPEAGGTGGVPLDAVTVVDAPRFGYRGLHLDVARNFHSRETVETLLDLMSLYKLNRFHVHLSDDEGWRLEIPGLPELTEVGGRRGHTVDERDHLLPSLGSGPDPDAPDNRGSGHYRRDDFVALLRHAAARHIRVIPEIDVPGHARAAIVAMEARARRGDDGYRLADPDDRSEYRSVQGWTDNVVNPCRDSTYRFLEKVVDEVVAMYAEAGAVLEAFHIGGDEVPAGVWDKSPACREWIARHPEIRGVDDLPDDFIERFADILAARGLTTAGWEEIALTELTEAEPPSAETEGLTEAPAKLPNPRFVERGFRAYVWNSVRGWGGEENAYRLANAGYPVVLANASSLYFDLAYDRHPDEPGLAWAGYTDARTAWELAPLDLYAGAAGDAWGRPLDPGLYADAVRLTEAGRTNVLGIQGQLWSETLTGPEVLEYLAFPKLLGLAERAWAGQPAWARETDEGRRRELQAAAWNEFANRVGRRELPRLARLDGGVDFRIPPPGAIVEDGVLKANVAYPGLEIRYTLDGSTVTPDSTLYKGPVAVDEGTARLRAFDARGRGGRSVEVEIE